MSRIALSLLLISPTFYAIVSGGLIGATVNLLTGLMFSQPLLGLASLIWASLLFVGSAILLIYVSIRLEDIRFVAANSDRRQAIIRQNVALLGFVLASVLFCIVGILILIVGAHANPAGGGPCRPS